MFRVIIDAALSLQLLASQPEAISTYLEEVEEPVELSNADRMRQQFISLREIR